MDNPNNESYENYVSSDELSDELPEKIVKEQETKIIPFLNGPYSQWFKKSFTVDNIQYNCCEQYMMAEKARLFDDQATLKKILATNSPAEQKKFGREVKCFSEKIWKKHRYEIVYKGNLAKFSQNDDIKQKLLATGDAILCEANPKDSIWGVALKAHDPKIKNPKLWKGLNLLGQALMQVRDALKKV